jgi:hypothetical protein
MSKVISVRVDNSLYTIVKERALAKNQSISDYLLACIQYIINKIPDVNKLSDRHSTNNYGEILTVEPEYYIIKKVNGELVKQETDLDGYPIYE